MLKVGIFMTLKVIFIPVGNMKMGIFNLI